MIDTSRMISCAIQRAGPGSPTYRNKLLVHTASSYNALVRALKQEVLEGHVKNPTDGSAIHDISRVSTQ